MPWDKEGLYEELVVLKGGSAPRSVDEDSSARRIATAVVAAVAGA